MPRSEVTIRDVAARAGVSYQTVSRVINDSAAVSATTRRRVEAAIAELNYRPNAIARFMAHGRTHTLVCIAPNLFDYTFASIIEGAGVAARHKGYVLFAVSAPNETVFASIIDDLVSSGRAEGLMVINPYADDRYTLIPNQTPTVFVGARPREHSASSVSLDDEGAARIATQHLLDLGRRRIAMITGPMAEDCSQDRLNGYQQALHNARLCLSPQWVIEGDWSATAGYVGFKQLMASDPPPDAVFAQNDRMAIGAIRAAHELGIAIPEQVSVIGVDDMPLAAHFDPPLTTMQQDTIAIGQQAVDLLVLALEHPESPHRHLQLSAVLIIRKSTATIEQSKEVQKHSE